MNESSDYRNRSQAEIESEVNSTRARMEHSVQELERRMSSEAMLARAASLIRSDGGEFVSNLKQQAKANPVPVVMAAGGLAWLMLSSSRSPRFGDAYDSEGFVRSGNESGHSNGSLSNVVNTAVDSVKQSMNSISNTARNVSDRISAKGAEAGDAAASLKGNATSKLGAAKTNAQALGHQAAENARMTQDRARRGVKSVSSTTARLYREQPFALGIAGLAVGALVGALIPNTRQENQLFAEHRDHLADEAKGRAQETLESMQATAAAKAQAASEQVREKADNLATSSSQT